MGQKQRPRHVVALLTLLVGALLGAVMILTLLALGVRLPTGAESEPTPIPAAPSVQELPATASALPITGVELLTRPRPEATLSPAGLDLGLLGLALLAVLGAWLSAESKAPTGMGGARRRLPGALRAHDWRGWMVQRWRLRTVGPVRPVGRRGEAEAFRLATSRLGRIAVTLSADEPRCIASALVRYQQAQGWSTAALAAWLGCSQTVLPLLGLCRRVPLHGRSLAAHASCVAAYTGCRSARLLALLTALPP